MVAIILVRHASTAWSGSRYCGTSDPPLSDAGIDEARRLAAELASTVPPETRLVASPSVRAVATAEAIAAAADARPIELDDRWREADCGLAEGRTFDELAAIAPDTASALAGGRLDIDWPSGETTASLRARVEEALLDLITDGQPALVVTHAGPLLHARAIAERRELRAEDLVGPATAVMLDIAADGLSGRPVLPSRA
jgi:broad specificity phosphatase PhoE